MRSETKNAWNNMLSTRRRNQPKSHNIVQFAPDADASYVIIIGPRDAFIIRVHCALWSVDGSARMEKKEEKSNKYSLLLDFLFVRRHRMQATAASAKMDS